MNNLISKSHQQSVRCESLVQGKTIRGFEDLIYRAVKLSSIDESKLSRKRISLTEVDELLSRIKQEINIDGRRADIATKIGVVLIMTTVVSDIIRDTLGEALSEKNFLMKVGLEHVYDKAREIKWKGNKYEASIEEVRKNVGYFEKAVAKIPNAEARKAVSMVLKLHKEMAANMMGLVGVIEDNQQTQMALQKQLRSMQASLDDIKKQISTTNFYLQTGEGAKAEPLFSARPPAQRML